MDSTISTLSGCILLFGALVTLIFVVRIPGLEKTHPTSKKVRVFRAHSLVFAMLSFVLLCANLAIGGAVYTTLTNTGAIMAYIAIAMNFTKTIRKLEE